MAELLAELVTLVLPEVKYFPATRSHLCSMFERREKVDITHGHRLPKQVCGFDEVGLRLRISGMMSDPSGWHISLLIQNCRVDGFGWEYEFANTEGNLQNGWHRHVWCPRKRDADGKIGVTLFDVDELTFEKFLLWSLKEMRILLMKEANSGNLYLDS